MSEVLSPSAPRAAVARGDSWSALSDADAAATEAPFVGREREHQQLSALVSAHIRGRRESSLIVIEAREGMGKVGCAAYREVIAFTDMFTETGRRGKRVYR